MGATMNHFGKNLADARSEAGMSAQTLSNELGGHPSRSVIANWETGRKDDITVKDLVRVSAALGVVPADICPELDFGRVERIASAKRTLRKAATEALAELGDEA